MDKLIIILLLMISGMLKAQTNFEMGMIRGLELYDQGHNEEASVLFEGIAKVEGDNWLPNYYIGLVNTTAALTTKDYNKVNHYLTTAQQALDKVITIESENVELLILQAMIHTAWISYDPMSYGPALYPIVMQLYGKAEKLAPENPRVVLSKSQFEMGSARFFGSDVQPICTQLERSIDLFDNFKLESHFHPNWGKGQALALIESCALSYSSK